MTTTVKVEANHGSMPVKVTGIDPKTGEPTMGNYGGIVPAGEKQDFICHSHMDLIIHEIQPDELKSDADVSPST